MLYLILMILAIAFELYWIIDLPRVVANPEIIRERELRHSMIAHRILPDWLLRIVGHTQV